MKFSRPEDELILLGLQLNSQAYTKDRIASLLADGIDSGYLLRQLMNHRVAPLFWYNVNSIDAVALPKPLADQLKAYVYENRMKALFFTKELLTILERFESNQIRVLPLKGPTLALFLYNDVSLRDFSDLDILVMPGDVPAATNILLDLGYRAYPKDEHHLDFGEHHLQFLDQDVHIVELHWSLAQNQYSFSGETNAYWEDLISKAFFNRQIDLAKQENQLLFLCAHGNKHYWSRLSWLCDIAYMCQAASDLDWAYLFREAQQSRTYRAFLLSLCLAHDTLNAQLPSDVAARFSADQELCAAVSEIQNQFFLDDDEAVLQTKRYLFHLRMIESSADKLRYLRYMFMRQMTPNQVDQELLSLPKGLNWFYYVLRIGRLIREYGLSVGAVVIKSLLSGFGNRRRRVE